MKKQRGRGYRPRTDGRGPSKAALDARDTSRKPVAVEGPGYDGPTKSDPTKSDTVPRLRRGKTKEAFAKDATRPRRPSSATLDLPDQRPPRRRPRTLGADMSEQYVRLRIRVRDGRLSVVDSHLVDGPLSPDKAFPGTNAYEVTLGDRLLHAGALPDLGLQRSFVDPNAPDDQQAHHLAERDVFEFSARVPAEALTPETIGDVEVRLHRVKGEARADVLSGDRLDVQFAREMRPVGELRGLPESVLPEEIERRGGHTPNA
jgi:hypothetical protein